VTSAPEGLLRLEFTPPPGVTWTLVRAELARRLAEQAVSQAASVSDADLATFARGRGLPRRTPEHVPVSDLAPVGVATRAITDVAAASPAEALQHADMLTGEALAQRLGVSRATVALRRTAGRLLALESGAKRGFRYPAWQVPCLRDPGIRGAFEEALRVLAPRGPWVTYRFFTEPSAPDRGTPLQRLDAGDIAGFGKCLAGIVR
jgi:hypothetical protein